MRFFHSRLMQAVGCRNGGYDNAVAAKPTRLDRIALDAIDFGRQSIHLAAKSVQIRLAGNAVHPLGEIVKLETRAS